MALRYFVAGSGGTNNWGTSGAGSNWSLTSGGAGGQAVPTAADDVIIDTASPATCTVDSTGRVCKTLTIDRLWTGTLVMNANITVSGAIFFGNTSPASFTISAGSGGKIESTVAAAHSSNGVYIPSFGLRGAVSHTLNDDFTCGTFVYGSTTNTTSISSPGKIKCNTLDMSLSTTGTLSGTAEIVMNGTGSIIYPTSTGVLRNNLTFNHSGTTTFATGTFRYNTGTITYTAGTVTASGCDLNIAAATILNTGANVVFGTINISGTTTVTLNANLYASGLTQLGGTTLTTTINGSDLYCGGGLTINGTTAVITGTSKIRLTGTGTWTVNTTTSVHAMDVIIAAGTGTVTCTSTARWPFNRVQYVSGTVVTSAGTWATAGGGGTVLLVNNGITGIGVF